METDSRNKSFKTDCLFCNIMFITVLTSYMIILPLLFLIRTLVHQLFPKTSNRSLSAYITMNIPKKHTFWKIACYHYKRIYTDSGIVLAQALKFLLEVSSSYFTMQLHSVWPLYLKQLTSISEGGCTWPTPFQSSTWKDNTRGDLVFTGTTMTGFTMILQSQTVNNWECVSTNHFDSEGILLLK